MNTKTIFAVALIALGSVVLIYSGITFKTPGKPVDFLGMHLRPPSVTSSRRLSGRLRSSAGSCCCS